MRTTTSATAALKVSAPAKTNPINRLKTTIHSPFLGTFNQSNGTCTARLFSV
jgi:hypothetical protein